MLTWNKTEWYLLAVRVGIFKALRDGFRIKVFQRKSEINFLSILLSPNVTQGQQELRFSLCFFLYCFVYLFVFVFYNAMIQCNYDKEICSVIFGWYQM